MNIFTKTLTSTMGPIELSVNQNITQFTMKVNSGSTARIKGTQSIPPLTSDFINFEAGEGITYTSNTTPIDGLTIEVLTGTVEISMVLQGQ